MFDPADVPPVADDETVARFATQRSQFRADMTVKQDLFIPNAQGETSVMRHRAEIWTIGRAVAAKPARTLCGRSDLQVAECIALNLQAIATPLPDNPNHADIQNWPESKDDRKAIAAKLASVASLLIRPPSSSG